MSIKELATYTAVCDWPECAADVMDPTDYSGWGELDNVSETLDDYGWWRDVDESRHYCDKHPAAWASDPEQVASMVGPYLLIHDGDTDNTDDDGRVSLIGGAS